MARALAETREPPAFVLGPADQDTTLAAALRRHLPDRSWSDVRRLCESGKVSVDDQRALDSAARVKLGQRVTIQMSAPRPRPVIPGFQVVFEDPHLLVIEKPAGISSVPYDKKEAGTAMDLIRDAWRATGRKATSTPLFIVHRIDKDTSGLLCFARTKLAERRLHVVFKQHQADRVYIAVAHGDVQSRRIESVLIPDRGDGLRGSTRDGHGQLSVTHVTAEKKLRGATLCRIQLETGRTHQIRIHLSEAGHPLVGETVYIRDFADAGGVPLPSPRLMLHAATLGFEHPVTGQRLDFETPPPPDFDAVVQRLDR